MSHPSSRDGSPEIDLERYYGTRDVLSILAKTGPLPSSIIRYNRDNTSYAALGIGFERHASQTSDPPKQTITEYLIREVLERDI
jgi:hypothetical protein